MTRFTIIGSGFGLYGYLPAVIDVFGGSILLPIKYKEKITSRLELAGLFPSIEWVATSNIAMERCSGIVIATQPSQQEALASHLVNAKGIKKIVLEKPVATCPEAALRIQSQLWEARLSYRVGFAFLHTKWAINLNFKKTLPLGTNYVIVWNFMAHHFSHEKHNWKRRHTAGGGVLRFYGIHLIALLAKLGYSGITQSILNGVIKDEPEFWGAEFIGPGLLPCSIIVNSRSNDACFQIKKIGEIQEKIVDLNEPFQLESNGSNLDSRVPILRDVLNSFKCSDEEYHSFALRVNNLWCEVERLAMWSS